MKFRWPRRRWGIETTLYRADGTPAWEPYVDHRRWWTRAGAVLAAADEIGRTQGRDPEMARIVDYRPVYCGPLNRAQYRAALDRPGDGTHRLCGFCAADGDVATFPTTKSLTDHIDRAHRRT